MSEEIQVSLNEQSLLTSISKVDSARKKLDNNLDKTARKSKDTWMLAVGVARATWDLTDTLLQAVGVKMDAVSRAMIQGAFNFVSILTPIVTAEAVTPGMQVAAAIGLVQIGMTIAAAMAAKVQQAETQQNLQTAASAFGTVSNLLGNPYWRA